MKKILILIALALPMLSMAQNDVAVVPELHGVLIFTDNTPLADYDIVGEITYQQDSPDPYVANPAQYDKIRRGLVINAILANRQVEGIITDIHDNGTGSAKMIIFRPGAKDRNLARVNEYKGVLYFYDCEPKNAYTSVKKFGAPSSFRYSVVRKGVIKKAAKKKMRKQGVNAVVVTYRTTMRDKANAIRFE